MKMMLYIKKINKIIHLLDLMINQKIKFSQILMKIKDQILHLRQIIFQILTIFQIHLMSKIILKIIWTLIIIKKRFLTFKVI